MTEHYSLQTEYGAADELFGAIITLDKKHFKELKASGAELTENVCRILENGPGRKYKGDPAFDFWFSLIREIKEMPLENFSEIAAMLRAETGKPLYYSEAFWLWGNNRAFESKFFELTLENFNQKRMSKKRTMERIIFRDALGCLPVCEKHGWLKMPKTRDELIEYANANGKTEAAAWLLDFKNRTADLAAERARAEKKAERELNADPSSVTELKRLWKYEKQSDGTIMITGYKGNALEVAVPARIGRSPVTAIGERAFSPNALRITEEQALARCRIMKITVPEGVRTIGEGAFGGEGACRAVSGFFNAFSDLLEVVLPRSLEAFSSREAAENAPRIFVNCRCLTVKVPHSPYAEAFCRSNKANFEFYGG